MHNFEFFFPAGSIVFKSPLDPNLEKDPGFSLIRSEIDRSSTQIPHPMSVQEERRRAVSKSRWTSQSWIPGCEARQRTAARALIWTSGTIQARRPNSLEKMKSLSAEPRD